MLMRYTVTVMLKLIFCIMIICTSTFVGFSFSHRLHSRKTVLEHFVKELNCCMTQMRYSSSSLAQIFSSSFGAFRFSDDRSFSSQFDEMLKSYDKVLTKEDMKILHSLSESIGTADIQCELSNINMHISMLQQNIKDAENNILLKSKLYKTLGLSFGLVLSILLV